MSMSTHRNDSAPVLLDELYAETHDDDGDGVGNKFTNTFDNDGDGVGDNARLPTMQQSIQAIGDLFDLGCHDFDEE